jgi:hypothetical protein
MPRYGLYQPAIEDRNVRRLYLLKVDFRKRTGKKVPMTVLINRILDDFFTTEALAASNPDSDTPPVQPETLPRPRGEPSSPSDPLPRATTPHTAG